MDGMGALTILKKRQQAYKRRKAENRALYNKKKKSYIQSKTSNDEFNFPELTAVELKNIKKQIRKRIIKVRVTNFVLSSLLFFTILSGILYLFIKKGII
jgi:hypothetical protein